MDALALLKSKRAHAARFANEGGATGERATVSSRDNWVSRPKGRAMKVLLEALACAGTPIKATSFDAIALPEGVEVDFFDIEQVEAALGDMVFIEIKSSNQERVQPDFTGFFFSLTEKEIEAADLLGNRHIVALYNRQTDAIRLTTVAEIFRRTKSTNWQVSVQL